MRKLSNRNEGGMSVGRRSAETGRRPPAELVFAGAVLLGFAVAVISKAMLPSDLVMPLVATTYLVLAAVLGMVAWWCRGMDPEIA